MPLPLTLSVLCVLVALAGIIAKRLDDALKIERRLELSFFWKLGA